MPIHGKPMLDWVVEAFRATGYVDKIIVVGPKELDKLECMRFVDKRIDSSSTLVRNVLRGIAYMRWTYYRRQPDHPGYLISFCDAVFLTPEAISDAIGHIRNNAHDLVLHYVEKETYEKHGIKAKRTYIPVDGKLYTGTSIYYVKKFTNFLSCIHLLGDLRKNRKDPNGLLGVMGLKGCTFAEIEDGLSRRTGRDVGIYISQFPEMGMDVDKEADVEAANAMLTPPWKKIEKILVIMNGSAGAGYHLSPVLRRLTRLSAKENISKEKTLERIVAALGAYGIKPEVAWTEYAGHAIELASNAAASYYDAVVAVGGDGTINEVVNGLVNTQTRLGIIPVGTANLLGSEMSVPANIEAACQVIAKGNAVEIDTGKVNDRYFALLAGIGLDAHVVSLVDSKVKNRWGGLAYPLVAMRELFRYPFNKIKIRTQEGIELECYYLFIQNGKTYASGFELTPDSKMNDGSMEILAFRTKSLISLLRYLLSRNKAKYCVEMKGVKYLEIETTQPIQIDGDYACDGPATIRVMPRSLQILTDMKE